MENRNRAIETARWTALSERDQTIDDPFVYGVRTTHVYCRPGCPSRMPKRENVLFFDSSDEASEKGYRPCKRCRPDQSIEENPVIAKIIEVCRFIEEAEDLPTLDDISQFAHYSPWHFQRTFKQITGISPRDYASGIRKNRFRERLSNSLSVTEALYAAGFGSPSRVYEQAAQWLAMKPTQYKNGGSGLTIRYGISLSSLGYVLAAATARGICTIELGDTKDTLILQLEQRFSKATLIDADRQFISLMDEVVNLVEHPHLEKEIPLDIQGTVFQEKVWKILKTIPAGQTMSYSEIAAEMGNPRATRAVANACGQNTIAIVVPCHRATTHDRTLGGYRWGIQRKLVLLKREGTVDSR